MKHSWRGDHWSTSRGWSPDQAAAAAESLDRFGRVFAPHHRRLADLLRLETSQVVLEVGAGVGHATLEVAKRVPDGYVTALDPAPLLLQELERRASEAGASNIRRLEADARETGLAERTFDRAFAADLLRHIAPLEDVLHELKRVVKPGGALAFLHQGLPTARLPESHAFHHGISLWADTLSDPIVPARLEAELQRVGLRNVRTETAFVCSTNVKDRDWWPIIDTARAMLESASILDEDQGREWLADVAKASERGECMIGIPLFFHVADVPGIQLRRA